MTSQVSLIIDVFVLNVTVSTVTEADEIHSCRQTDKKYGVLSNNQNTTGSDVIGKQSTSEGLIKALGH